MGIAVEGVGHVVLKVRDLDEAIGFFSGRARARRVRPHRSGSGAMGPVHGRAPPRHRPAGGRPGRPPARPGDVGLFHVALKIGEGLDALRARATISRRVG